MRKGPVPTDVMTRFLRRVAKLAQPEGECWEWPGALNGDGYGYMKAGSADPDSPCNYTTHRLSFIHSKGQPPAGTEVTHSCDNRKCWNPAHLHARSHQQNIQEMFDRGRKSHVGSNNANWRGGISPQYQRAIM